MFYFVIAGHICVAKMLLADMRVFFFAYGKERQEVERWLRENRCGSRLQTPRIGVEGAPREAKLINWI
jgi:hypothetical protein